MYKCLHLIFATFLLGTAVFNYLFLVTIGRANNPTLRQQALTTSLTIDKVIVAILSCLFISGTIISPIYHWPFNTPWIEAAYLLLSCTTALWFLQAWLKHRALTKNKASWWYHALTVLIVACLIVIIKDAVTKQTWLPL